MHGKQPKMIVMKKALHQLQRQIIALLGGTIFHGIPRRLSLFLYKGSAHV